MADLQWEANSEQMYEKLIESSPKPFRAMTKKKLTEAIMAKVGDGGTVTEDVIVECTKEVTPKPFVGMALKHIEPMMSNKG
jgi:hypothetical protein